MKRTAETALGALSPGESQGYTTRARLEAKAKGKDEDRSLSSVVKKGKDRWRPNRVLEDYVNLVGDMMYPKLVYPAYGYDSNKSRFPFERITTLGYLLNPVRRPTVAEKWSPYEIAVFEASLTLFGKNFHQVAKFIKTKSTKDVIEFYYMWKKTGHYKQWKKVCDLPDWRDDPDVLREEEEARRR